MIKKIPKIRFQNFSEGWELSKLNELVERVTRKNTNLESTLPLTISALDGLVDQETYFNKKVASRDVSNYYLLKNGDFAYNKSYSNGYPLGAVKRLDLHEQGVLSTLYIAFRPTNIDSNFLVSYYDTNKWHKEVLKRASEGARNHGLLNISPTDFFDTELAIPINIYEQEKIGNFFKELDKSIKLNQHALNLLKQRKKAFLQKMFPKKGECSPQIRFENYFENWGKRELGDLSEKVTKKNTKKIFTETFTNSAEHGIISQRDYFYKDISNKKNIDGYYIVKPNYFIYNPRISNFAPVGPIKRNKLGRTGIMSPLYYVFKTKNINTLFLDQYFLTSYWHDFMKKNGDSGARSDRFAIKNSDLIKMPIPYPSIEEQEKIGNFFNELEDSISLQEEKLESLKQMKKAFLQKMFV